MTNEESRSSKEGKKVITLDGLVKSLSGRHSREGGSPEALVKTGFPPPRE
jgi:hypothetical protein